MRTKANIALLLGILGTVMSSSAFADKVCLKVAPNKKGKIITSKKITPACPRGFTEITDTADSQRVSAENVVLGSSKSMLLAEENSVGRLKSKNLNQALDEELAFDVFNLSGSRWSVENFNQVGQNGFTAQGELRFENNSSVVVTSGTVEAIGASSQGSGGPGPDWCTSQSYTLSFISPAIASIVSVPEINSSPSRGVIQISVLNKNTMVWTGQVPCGINSFLNVSKLSRIVN